MPSCCCIVGCGGRSDRDILRFYRLPKELQYRLKVQLNLLSSERRKEWLKAINRADWTDSKLKNAKICSRHFVSGRPSSLIDKNNPDWVPSQNLGYACKPVKAKKAPFTVVKEAEAYVASTRGHGINEVEERVSEVEIENNTDNAEASGTQCVDDDLKNICRFCLVVSDTMVSLQETLDPNKFVKAGDFVTSICIVPIEENDCLPQFICRSCFNNVLNMFLFTQQCKSSDKKLRQIFEEDKEQSGHEANNSNRRKHTKDHQNIKSSEINLDQRKKRRKKEYFMCNVCQCWFSKDLYLIAHMCQHHGRTLEDIRMNEIKPSLEDSNLQQGDVGELKNTMTQHSIVRCYTCDECQPERLFQSKALCVDHHMEVHNRPYDALTSQQLTPVYFDQNGTKLFENNTTDRGPIYKNFLINGLEVQVMVLNDYEKEKQVLPVYECEHCQKIFNAKTTLACHIKIHHIKPLQRNYLKNQKYLNENLACSACPRVFTKKDLFEKHQKTHEGVRNFICEVCSASFATKDCLTQHMRTHAGTNRQRFECHICGKQFYHKKSLHRCLLVHTGVKNFKCGICGRAFYEKKELLRHGVVHTDRHKLVCKLCFKCFSSRDSYRVHLKSHRKNILSKNSLNTQI